jgi:hypothetical protein
LFLKISILWAWSVNQVQHKEWLFFGLWSILLDTTSSATLQVPLRWRILGSNPEGFFLSFYVAVFILRSFDVSPDLRLPLYSVSFTSMHRITDHWLLLARRKLPLTYLFSFEIRVIGRERRPHARPTCEYLNNRSHGQNLRSTPGKAEPIAQYLFKIRTQDCCGFGIDRQTLWPIGWISSTTHLRRSLLIWFVTSCFTGGAPSKSKLLNWHCQSNLY